MNVTQKRTISLCLSLTIFASPYLLAAPCYADPKIEQIQPQKQTETTQPQSFKERMQLKEKENAHISNMQAGEAYIPAGTQVSVATINELTSKKNKKGEQVQFKLLENLILNDVVVIPSGATVYGRLTDVTSSGFFGRAGKLIFSIDSVKTVNGVEIPLEYMGKIEAGSDGGAVVVTAVVSLLGGFLMKGKNVNIPAGTKFAAKVKNDTDLQTTLKDLKTAMNPEKPHGVSITIK